ncbi:MAG: helix-turn-helix transcriptional regulator [Butyricicoccus sp.]|nr:helix-turn-helix transcriptional regulator [Butyricicoccus sp.]
MAEKQHQPLDVQCFVKKEFTPVFTGENKPKLLYVSRISPAASTHPRIMHAHDDFVELLLTCSGESDYLIHDRKEHITPGDLIVYNAGVVHDEVSGPGKEIGSYCVAIAGIRLPGLAPNMLIPSDARPVFETGEMFEDMRMLCKMMFEQLSSGAEEAEAVCHYLMLALLRKVLALTSNIHEQPIPEPDILGRRIKEYIDRHYMEPITLQDIGEALHMSPYYLSHVFKQMSGYSPVQYLLRRRIGEAQTLLITTDYSITRISEMVGYDTQSYFNLQFTKHVVMPPNKYRKNYIVSAAKSDPKRKKKK